MASTAITVIEPAQYSERNTLQNAVQSLVLDGLSSPHTRRAYEQALEEFLIWLCADTARPFTKAAVQRYRTELQAKGLASASVNVRISCSWTGFRRLLNQRFRHPSSIIAAPCERDERAVAAVNEGVVSIHCNPSEQQTQGPGIG
jgi:site-specific recombinase XerD